MLNSRSLFNSARPVHCGVADGSWKISRVPADNRLYRIGDAACTIDPSSGKGVLRAMMSAIMSVHLISGISRDAIGHAAASEHYGDWLQSLFDGEVAELERIRLSRI